MRARRMVRAFTTTPVAPSTVDALVGHALGGPSAGNSRSLHVVVLDGNDTARYWAVSLPPAERSTFPWPGLLIAPVLFLVYVEPDAYIRRYGESDKTATGLGRKADAWPVPYWWVDGGAAVENVLLGAIAHGLGACFFGQFEHEDAIRAEFGAPAGMRAVGTIAIGHPDPLADRTSRSGARGRPDRMHHVHRGQW